MDDLIPFKVEFRPEQRSPRHKIALIKYDLRLVPFCSGRVHLIGLFVPGRLLRNLIQCLARLHLRLCILSSDLGKCLLKALEAGIFMTPSVKLAFSELLPRRQPDRLS